MEILKKKSLDHTDPLNCPNFLARYLLHTNLRKPTTYRIPDENDIYGDEPEKRGRGRRSAPVEVAKPK